MHGVVFAPNGLLGTHRKLMPTAIGKDHLGLRRRVDNAGFRDATRQASRRDPNDMRE
jgi:hypothetical protein